MARSSFYVTVGSVALSLFVLTSVSSAQQNIPTVTITGATELNLPAKARAQFTAVVTNDPSNSGVSWSVSCSPEPCGSVSPTKTASGSPTTYVAPAVPPVNTLTVDVTATSVADPAQSTFAIVYVEPVGVSVGPLGALLPAATSQLFTATVTWDPNNAGVKWTLTEHGTACNETACGTLKGVAPLKATYTAPSSVTSDAIVSLTATSVTAPTKSAAASIRLSTRSIRVSPDNLNFGSVIVNSTSTPQLVTVSNVGKTTVNITSIEVTAGNPNFIQTNTCGSELDAGQSCRITVKFKPTKIGTLASSIAIVVNDGTQSVTLTGTGHTRPLINRDAVRSALESARTVTAPIPTGSDVVGTRILEVIDQSRQDPFVRRGAPRELLIRFWYPASLDGSCHRAQYTAPNVWNYFSQLLETHLPEVVTNSCENSAVAEGAHPVVVFTHGYTGTFTDYTFIFEELASHGYVVASVDHTYEATAVEFPDGRFVRSRLGSHLTNTWQGDAATLAFAMSARVRDLAFVRTELQRLNVKADSAFKGKLDLSRVAIAGHSMGGAAALLTLEQDEGYKAAIILDGYLPASLVLGTKAPVFVLTAGSTESRTDYCAQWKHLRGPQVWVDFSSAEHLTPSDAVWLAQGAVSTGSSGPDVTVAAIRESIVAFLEGALSGGSFESSGRFPKANDEGISVFAGDQLPCSQP